MAYSKSKLRLARVAVLETRMAEQMCSLIRRHGGVPVCIPAVSERPADASAAVGALIDRLAEGIDSVVVLQTGVSVAELARVAEALGRSEELIDGLRAATAVCRGPKPVAALRRLGLVAGVVVPEPHTTQDLIATLSAMPLAGTRVAVVHHGERNAGLVDALKPICGGIDEVAVYRWELPEDTAPLQALPGELIDGLYDAIAFTSQIQVRHLFSMASSQGLEQRLAGALQERVTTAAVGPTCAEELRARGVQPDVVPRRPKMGHMVVALAGYLESRDSRVGVPAGAGL